MRFLKSLRQFFYRAFYVIFLGFKIPTVITLSVDPLIQPLAYIDNFSWLGWIISSSIKVKKVNIEISCVIASFRDSKIVGGYLYTFASKFPKIKQITQGQIWRTPRPPHDTRNVSRKHNISPIIPSERRDVGCVAPSCWDHTYFPSHSLKSSPILCRKKTSLATCSMQNTVKIVRSKLSTMVLLNIFLFNTKHEICLKFDSQLLVIYFFLLRTGSCLPSAKATKKARKRQNSFYHTLCVQVSTAASPQKMQFFCKNAMKIIHF